MFNKNTFKYKIGIDEAGRGPWAGPVVACALCFDPKNIPNKKFLKQINDSKKLSEKKREELYKDLIKMSNLDIPKVFFGVGVVDNYIIDEINIKQANKEAMRRALVELLRKIPATTPLITKKKGSRGDIEVLIDGNDNYSFSELKDEPIFIIGGDGKITEIGAASIIAKVFRDKLMKSYASLYPKFSFETNVGYGTKKHKENLKKKKDITGIHRLSYKPVKEVLLKNNKV